MFALRAITTVYCLILIPTECSTRSNQLLIFIPKEIKKKNRGTGDGGGGYRGTGEGGGGNRGTGEGGGGYRGTGEGGGGMFQREI